MNDLQKRVFDEIKRQRKEKRFDNIDENGAFVVSVARLAKECNISKKRADGILFILETLGEITLVTPKDGGKHITRVIINSNKEESKSKVDKCYTTHRSPVIRRVNGKMYLADNSGRFYESTKGSSGSTYNISNSYLASMSVQDSLEISRTTREYKTVRERLAERQNASRAV